MWIQKKEFVSEGFWTWRPSCWLVYQPSSCGLCLARVASSHTPCWWQRVTHSTSPRFLSQTSCPLLCIIYKRDPFPAFGKSWIICMTWFAWLTLLTVGGGGGRWAVVNTADLLCDLCFIVGMWPNGWTYDTSSLAVWCSAVWWQLHSASAIGGTSTVWLTSSLCRYLLPLLHPDLSNCHAENTRYSFFWTLRSPSS